jgi:hypothetical protein
MAFGFDDARAPGVERPFDAAVVRPFDAAVDRPGPAATTVLPGVASVSTRRLLGRVGDPASGHRDR